MFESSGFVQVELGATLYYELRGTDGPLLLIISAGMGTAHAHELTSILLSRRFRVLTYDRRGFSRSRIKEPFGGAIRPAEVVIRNAQDAAALIRHFSPNSRPALVFGSCFGGTIALQLLQLYPELVEMAVVHEPAVPLLVSKSNVQHVQSTLDSLSERLERSGGEAAAEAATSLILKDDDRRVLQKTGAYDRLIKRSAQQMTHFFKHESKYNRTHMVDWNALWAQRDKLILAIGIESELPIQRDPARCIAERIGSRMVEMPGAHFPFSVDRKRAAKHLVALFGQRPLEGAEKSLL